MVDALAISFEKKRRAIYIYIIICENFSQSFSTRIAGCGFAQTVSYGIMDSSSWLLIHQGCATIMLGGSSKNPTSILFTCWREWIGFMFFCSWPTRFVYIFTGLHCKKHPHHHPCVGPLDRPRVQVNTVKRDDRTRYLVESQMCQERRISPGPTNGLLLGLRS